MISGNLTDTTGAVVAGAKVTATHLGTGTAYKTLTNGNGYFAFTALPIGEYEIKAEFGGFRTFDQKGITLHADTSIAVNISLEIGQEAQTITVTGTPPAIETKTNEISTLISGAQVRELALNGRNFTQLLVLGPGVVSEQVGRRTGVGQEGNPLMSINGGRINSTRFTFDGVIAMDTGGNRGVNLFPPMEAIQEVQIHKSNYSADSGSFGYGMVNVVTKSGGNEFHGDVYETLGNSALDARNFFASSLGPFKDNIFGYTIGGPAFPGARDSQLRKTYVFWSQGWNIRRGPQLVDFTSPPQSTFTSLTPDAAMRQGDFRALGTTITNPSTHSPFLSNIIPDNLIDSNAKILLERFYPLPNRAGSPNYVVNPNSAMNWREELVRLDHQVSDKVSLMARYAHDSWEEQQAISKPGPQAFPTVGGTFRKPGHNLVLQLTNSISPTRLNNFIFGFSLNRITRNSIAGGQRPKELTVASLFNANVENVIPTINLSQNYGSIGVGDMNNVNPVYSYKDDFHQQLGNHLLKLGFEFLRIQKFDNYPTSGRQGTFTFDGSFTRNPIGDFLLGLASRYTERANILPVYLFASDYEMYAQDDWQAKPNLTFNLGLRWQIMAGAPNGYEKYDHLANFVPALYDPARAPTITSSGQLAPVTGDPLNGIITPKNQKGLDLPRSLRRTRYVLPGPRVGFAWSPRGSQTTVLRGGYGIFYHWDNNNQELLSQNPPFSTSASIFNTTLSNPSTGSTAIFPPNLESFDYNNRYPMVQHYSLNVQRALGSHLVLSVAYVGNRAVHLDQTVNINQPLPSVAVAMGRTNVNTVRPYSGYGTINYDTRSASATYNSLQAHLRREFSGGLLLEAGYTYSKSLAYNVGQDQRRNEEALSGLDRQHVFTFNYLYELPFFQKREGITNKLLGGWQVSGVTTIQSGAPFTVTVPGDIAGVGSGGQRPDVVGKITYPKRLDRWFDTTAFRPAAPGQFGNERANALRGPGINHWDLSFMKNTRVYLFKDRVAKTQFGAQFFNAFNHPSFTAPVSARGSPIFGRITSARDPRQIQFLVRISY